LHYQHLRLIEAHRLSLPAQALAVWALPSFTIFLAAEQSAAAVALPWTGHSRPPPPSPSSPQCSWWAPEREARVVLVVPCPKGCFRLHAARRVTIVVAMATVKPPPSRVVSFSRCSSVRGVRVVLLVRLRLIGNTPSASWPSMATVVVPWLSTGGERERAQVWVGRPGLAGPGRIGQAEGEREQRGCAWAAHARPVRPSGRRKVGSQPELMIFVFLFSKNAK
jgi:hypothetical protein